MSSKSTSIIWNFKYNDTVKDKGNVRQEEGLERKHLQTHYLKSKHKDEYDKIFFLQNKIKILLIFLKKWMTPA